MPFSTDQLLEIFVLENPQITGMLVKSQAIAQHCRKFYQNFENHTKDVFFGEADYVDFTQDAWTSPKTKKHGFLRFQVIISQKIGS